MTYGEVVDRDAIHRLKELSLEQTVATKLSDAATSKKRETFAYFLELFRDERSRLFEGWANGTISLDLTFRHIDFRVYRGSLA